MTDKILCTSTTIILVVMTGVDDWLIGSRSEESIILHHVPCDVGVDAMSVLTWGGKALADFGSAKFVGENDVLAEWVSKDVDP